MPHFMIVLIPYINLLNLSWIIKYLFLSNMEPLITLEDNKDQNAENNTKITRGLYQEHLHIFGPWQKILEKVKKKERS